MGIKWMDSKVVKSARALAGRIPEQGAKDECMVCGKPIRRHRTVTGEGRVCSLTCAQYWAENMS
ncbi:hypothetical protein GCM10022243_62280 [Saccharothrix violaceirubra]|uniref:Uncharacterized protein n=1 Tax=Saccharothrix violaceirubra TaxID=413306 RepID=A0A7W7WYP3_9PSEU|nr:hypothetical protein [Saccharothrix violaceirubra]MBB4968206.1 hypothetical protein [Saccharothrix violaceirubra]